MNMVGKLPKTSFIIKNSPIEFAIVGSKGDHHNGVLVRSDNLQTDLIGFAAIGSESSDFHSNSITLIYRIFFPSRKMYSVPSDPQNQLFTQLDNRKSEYRFYWVGACTRSDRESVRNIFTRQIVDLLLGIELSDVDQVEWSIAPVILRCAEIHKRSVERNRSFIFIMIMYTIMVLLASIYYISFRIH